MNIKMEKKIRPEMKAEIISKVIDFSSLIFLRGLVVTYRNRVNRALKKAEKENDVLSVAIYGQELEKLQVLFDAIGQLATLEWQEKQITAMGGINELRSAKD